MYTCIHLYTYRCNYACNVFHRLPACPWLFRDGSRSASFRAKDRTPEIPTSEIIVDFFGGIFQRNFACQRPFPKDCRLLCGFLLEMPNGCSMAFSNITSLL